MDTEIARNKVLAEIDLREALYALNRAISKLPDVHDHLKSARNIVWTEGIVLYEWTD